MFILYNKIKKIKKYMNDKEQLIDSMFDKLKLLDDKIVQFNNNVDNTINIITDLKSSYDLQIDDLHKKINLNKEKRNIKIAVIIHLYYVDLWNEFKKLIYNIHYDVDIYVNLVDGSVQMINLVNFKRKLEEEYPNIKVFINENAGLDIGGTLNVINYIIKENKHYEYVLKLHSKKSIHTGRMENKNGDIWRNELIDPILGDYKTVNSVIDLFVENPIIGMIGSKKWLLDKHKNIYQNSEMLQTYINIYNITVPLDDIQFIGGSIFWVRFDILKDFFTKNDPIKIIRTFEKNSFTDDKELKWTHAFERVFGLMVLNYGKKIIGV